MAKNEDAYYFGCYDLAGHFLYAAQRHDGEPIATRVRYYENNPWGRAVDGALCPADVERKQGRALLHRRDGWTAIAFWDRSSDQRPNSCSVFMRKGEHDFAEMVDFAGKTFPMIFARFRFEVVNVTPPEPVISKDGGKSRQRLVD